MPLKAPSAAMTVTLVDDEPQVLEALVQAVRGWKIKCQTATGAAQALQLLEQCPTPVVVIDLQMAGRKGIGFMHEVRRRWPGISLIITTAEMDYRLAIECLNADADRYLLKPVRMSEFRHALETLLQPYQVRQQHDRHHRYLKKTVRRRTLQLRRTYLSAVESLVRTLEARDAYTSNHSLRVRRYSIQLGTQLGFERRELKRISLAAKLHDIGKVGVPEGVLNKPGMLSEEEWHLVRAHPLIGERILAPVIRDPVVLAAVRHHHERYDGKGYPEGRAGTDIPVAARLITITDCFDALTSWRAYRDGMPVAEALEILRQGSGTHFDPVFTPAFIRVVEENMAREGNALALDGKHGAHSWSKLRPHPPGPLPPTD